MFVDIGDPFPGPNSNYIMKQIKYENSVHSVKRKLK